MDFLEHKIVFMDTDTGILFGISVIPICYIFYLVWSWFGAEEALFIILIICNSCVCILGSAFGVAAGADNTNFWLKFYTKFTV